MFYYPNNVIYTLYCGIGVSWLCWCGVGAVAMCLCYNFALCNIGGYFPYFHPLHLPQFP